MTHRRGAERLYDLSGGKDDVNLGITFKVSSPLNLEHRPWWRF